MIPFNKPYMVGKELFYIAKAHFNGKLSGDGPFTKQCHAWLEKNTECAKALLTHSCTAALEMSAILANLQPGDEVIMPSYTFVSTANAFVLRGAVPVFVDVRKDTMNIDENLIEGAITEKTRAIVPVHYAGVSCEMDKINDIAKRHGLFVIEDAAQGICAKYKGRPLGAIGDIGTFSFHETKNVISGEGGCILINNPEFSDRAEIIREKGTNRSQFFRGQIDKYTWRDIGSSFLPGEITASFLLAQLEETESLTRARLRSWNVYHEALRDLESEGFLRRPIVPDHCEHNAHMYYILLDKKIDRDKFLEYMKENGVLCVSHYEPLHESPAGVAHARTHMDLAVTEDLAARLARLPLWNFMEEEVQQKVVDTLIKFFKKI